VEEELKDVEGFTRVGGFCFLSTKEIEIEVEVEEEEDEVEEEADEEILVGNLLSCR